MGKLKETLTESEFEGKITIDCDWDYDDTSEGNSADLVYKGIILLDDEEKEIERICNGKGYQDEMAEAITRVNSMGKEWVPSENLEEYDGWYLDKWGKTLL